MNPQIQINNLSTLETDFRSLLFPQVQGGNPILKFGNSRFFRSNVGRWEHDFRSFFGKQVSLHLTQLTKFFVGKNHFQSFLGGIMFLYYPSPWNHIIPPPKAVGKLSFLYQLVEYVRVTLWHPSKLWDASIEDGLPNSICWLDTTKLYQNLDLLVCDFL